MYVLDLFSGIGGFSLGLERAGMRTVAFCESDEYCRAVLRKHWPDVPCFNDIHAIDSDGLGRLGQIDLVCGGFPCQPFSVAGSMDGKADDRYLWPEMRRVIALTRPTWVICENVIGLITVALDDVLADLEADGYTARTFVIPAAGIGARHRRDRLWIIATDTNRSELREQPGRRDGPNGKDSIQPGVDGAPRIVADSHCSGLEIGKGKPGNPRSQLTPAVGAGWWSFEPDVGRVAHGIPGRVDRLRCLGNAVVPQIVEEIGRAVMRVSK